jgi:bifunctional non-homologous end joining protein LigD
VPIPLMLATLTDRRDFGEDRLLERKLDGERCVARKCASEQELVIGGFTDPAGSRTDFGALLVGYHEDGVLRYAGRVGTGYSLATLHALGARLRELQTRTSPFADARPVPRGAHWVRPELVAQIGFAEWTTDGRLRQARFPGLRDDKRATEVVRERPGA